VLIDASGRDARAWTGTLADLSVPGAGLRDEDDAGPGTIVIGEVVSLASVLCLSQAAPGRVAAGHR
jgi:siroheme synthase